MPLREPIAANLREGCVAAMNVGTLDDALPQEMVGRRQAAIAIAIDEFIAAVARRRGH